MKHSIFILVLLFVSVVSTACINNLAIQELNNKAKVYIEQGDTESAICRLQSSLELDNQVFETHYNLAIAYLNSKTYDKALAEIEEVIKLNPVLLDAFYTKAVILEEYANYLKEEIEDNKNKDLHEKVIELLEKAIVSYQEYLSLDKDNDSNDEINEKIDDLKEDIEKLAANNQKES